MAFVYSSALKKSQPKIEWASGIDKIANEC